MQQRRRSRLSNIKPSNRLNLLLKTFDRAFIICNLDKLEEIEDRWIVFRKKKCAFSSSSSHTKWLHFHKKKKNKLLHVFKNRRWKWIRFNVKFMFLFGAKKTQGIKCINSIIYPTIKESFHVSNCNFTWKASDTRGRKIIPSLNTTTHMNMNFLIRTWLAPLRFSYVAWKEISEK